MNISLNGSWKLKFFPEEGTLPENPAELASFNASEIEATIPGNVELDLMNAGIEQDPFYGENLYNYRKYEFCQWWFIKSFFCPSEEEVAEDYELCFEGVNTFATYWLNGNEIGRSENMLISHSFKVKKELIFGGQNELCVRIESAINKAREYDYPAMCLAGDTAEYSMLRMPPHSFGWDIMPRLVSAGMWRGVSLNTLKAERIRNLYIATDAADENSARLRFNWNFASPRTYLDKYEIIISGSSGDSHFEVRKPALFTHGKLAVTVDSPKLWWPRGYGEAALYDIEFKLIYDGKTVDSLSQQIGIRKFDIEHTLLPGDDGEFMVSCNGVKILCKGSNHVPLDALHSRDAERYEKVVELYSDMGCNIIRCWGGNVYEDDRFFELCDKNGIMVWQDFTLACTTSPQDAIFLAKIEEEAESVIKKLRNHPSILLWAGDNEVDEAYIGLNFPTYSNRYNAISREVLPRVVRMHDPYRHFMPSSPYIPEGIKRYDVPEQHNWGARAYFKDDFYKHSSAHFISEVGYHACPSPESLKKYIPEDKLSPRIGNSVWDTHNTDYLPEGGRDYNRIQLMTDQVEILAGEVPEELALYSKLSQLSQAEAKKFFVEKTRIKKWRTTGVIWWNMLDGWPQISDAIVDYYFDKKLAYTWLKRVHTPICLMFDELRDWGHDIILGNDSREDKTIEWSVENEEGELLASGRADSKANQNLKVGYIRELAGKQQLFILRWKIDGREYVNHYMSGFPPYDKNQLITWADKIENLK